MSDFFEAFNQAIPDLEKTFTETWDGPDGRTWPAIEIEDMQLSQVSGAPGGALAQAKVTVHVRLDVFTRSGVARGNIITARGERVRVMTIGNDGDDARLLICGPQSVAIPTT